MNRVNQLADRPAGFTPENAIPFKNFIPLDEIIADAKGVSKTAVAVEREYRQILSRLGTEFDVLTKVSQEDLDRLVAPKIAEGIARVRAGKVRVAPGYDGEYGKISIFSKEEFSSGKDEQMSLF
jgi:PHP family Zn ribbon phosphoesterase